MHVRPQIQIHIHRHSRGHWTQRHCDTPDNPPKDVNIYTHTHAAIFHTDRSTELVPGSWDLTGRHFDAWEPSWGQRTGSRPSGRHADLVEGATVLAVGGRWVYEAPRLSFRVSFPILEPESPDHCVTLAATSTMNPLLDETVFLHPPFWWVSAMGGVVFFFWIPNPSLAAF